MLWSVPVLIETPGSVLIEEPLGAIVGYQPGQRLSYRHDSTRQTEPGHHLIAESYVVNGREGKAVALLNSPRTTVHASIHAFHDHIGKVVIEVRRDGFPIHTYFLPEER